MDDTDKTPTYRCSICERLYDPEFDYMCKLQYAVTRCDEVKSEFIQKGICNYHFWRMADISAPADIVAMAAMLIALFDALLHAKAELDKDLSPDGYNIGINDGLAAGQTILHLHVHLIPRYKGDVPDPRGGIRWIFPDKAVYWKD